MSTSWAASRHSPNFALVAVCYAVGPIILQRRLSDLPAMGVIAASLAVTAILDERFTVGMGVGFALVLVGSALATRPPVPARDAEPALAGPA